MKIKASNIQKGDRICAYFNNKMQVCTVKYVSNADQPNIRLTVFHGERYRYTNSGIIQFKSEDLIDLVNKNIH